MALGAQLPVRLDPAIDARLERAAKRVGTSKSAIIRLLVKTFVEQVVQPDGSVSLPPNWRNYLRRADGRSQAQVHNGRGNNVIRSMEQSIAAERRDAAVPAQIGVSKINYAKKLRRKKK